MASIRRLAADFRAALASLEPAAWSGEDAAAIAGELAVTENACAAAKIRMAQRASRAGARRARGFADASDWMASTTGTTIREARRQLDAVDAIDACPETRDALIAGEVSIAQAHEIAHAEAAAPGCEEELLDLAKRRSLGVVRERARARRLEAIDRDELYAKQHAARELSHWRDDLGMVRGSFALTPEVGVALVNQIDAEANRLIREAKRAGREAEPRRALAADALVRVLCGAPSARPGAPTVNVVIDWPALARGHAHPGERSHVVGSGPLPARVARRMMSDAFLTAVLTDGVDVQRVLHLGRHIPAELRTAIELGPPPGFAGVTCAEAGCDRRYGLEWDHAQPLASGGPTSMANLQPLCGLHHSAKTERDRASGLLRDRGGSDGRAPPGRPPP